MDKGNKDGSGVDDRIRGAKFFLRHFLAGGTSASIAVTIMAPIERVKLILQIQNANPKLKSEDLYKGFFDASKKIVREQGFFSFWRGNSSAVVRCFPYLALNFSIKEKLKEKFQKGVDFKNQNAKRLVSNSLIGGSAGAIAMASIYPLDFARTRIATDLGGNTKERHFASFIDCIQKTTRRDGIVGLYRGLSFSLIGVFIYRSSYFGLYDTFKEILRDDGKDKSLFLAFLSAELAATFSGLISYPFDTVRRSMMMQSGFKDENKLYKGSIDCMKTIFQKQGIRGFNHGSLINILRGSGGAIMLVAFDELQILLDKKIVPRTPHIYVPAEDDTYEDTEDIHHYRTFDKFLNLFIMKDSNVSIPPKEADETESNSTTDPNALKDKKFKESKEVRHERIIEKSLCVNF